MHGLILSLIPQNIICFSRPQFSKPLIMISYRIDFNSFVNYPPTFGPILKSLSKSGGGRRNSNGYLRASRRESPYEVLGVSPSAAPNEIKRAYRRLALKYHPDVNKEATAQQKFMRIKHAYNTLLNSESRGRYDYGDRSSEYSYYSTQRNQGRNRQEEEEFYGFGNFLKDVQITIGDLFKDIQEEFQNWEAGASSQGKPKSLWEELAEIGEEFVEFIEKELNISEPETETETDNNDEWPQRGHPFKSSGSEKNQADKESCIEEDIDEIEATLAQLKKELGL